MKKYLFVLMLLPMLMMGCEDGEILNRKPVTRTYEDDKFRVSFWLETVRGEKATVFLQGEEISMRYVIENLTSDSVYLADGYSSYNNTPHLGCIYSQSNDEHITGPIIYDPYWRDCKHYEPGVVKLVNYIFPHGFDGEYLEKGKYYVEFQPRLGYNKHCLCNEYDREDIVRVNTPTFRIDFEVR